MNIEDCMGIPNKTKNNTEYQSVSMVTDFSPPVVPVMNTSGLIN